ncbi:MAG TPA: AAA family ATPase [Planctomycetota bacterium]|nr:AAA family ATPase [Planctomycetota bacterium]
MYQEYFGFDKMPFNTTPDSRFFFPSSKHAEALASLIYAVSERKGFVVITGEVGAGKTTVCRILLNRIDPGTKVVLITNTHINCDQLFEMVCAQLGLDADGRDKAGILQMLSTYLLDQLAERAAVLLIIDEAQNLSSDVLEEVRMLSNLETERDKLLQVVLLGQPELRRRLHLPELRQFRQRIVVTYHLSPLSLQETIQYIFYRLKVAGGMDKVKFTRRAVNEIYDSSKGIPRLINIICDSALLTCFVRGVKIVSQRIVEEVVHELGIDDLATETEALANGPEERGREMRFHTER